MIQFQSLLFFAVVNDVAVVAYVVVVGVGVENN